MINESRLEVVFHNRPLLEKLNLLTFLEGEFKLPYKTPLSDAFDLFAVIEDEFRLYPNVVTDVPTGLSFQAYGFPFDVGIRLFIRSGVSKQLTLANAVGLVDPDYQGQLMLRVLNHSTFSYLIKPGERLAQAEFYPVLRIPTAIVKDQFSQETKRGQGGFGHTGKF